MNNQILFSDTSVLHSFKYYFGLGGKNINRELLPHIQHPVYTLSATNTPSYQNDSLCADDNDNDHVYKIRFGKLLFHNLSISDSKQKYDQSQLESKLNNKDMLCEFTPCINFHQETYIRETIYNLGLREYKKKHTCEVYVDDLVKRVSYIAKFEISDSQLCFLKTVKKISRNRDNYVKYYCSPSIHNLDMEVTSSKKEKEIITIFGNDKELDELQKMLKSAEWNDARNYIHFHKTSKRYDNTKQVVKNKIIYSKDSNQKVSGMKVIHSLNYTICSDLNLNTTKNTYTVKNGRLSNFL